ncbi:mannose-1-phosphate guanylyltransferase [Klebsiella pneumoniae]|nr:mannose-1-phosphate guanylyltransferase [Klebsiella pneumoniae]
MSNLYPVIMAGGTGSRLWPLSRELFPKQFLALCNEFSMLQTTVMRLKGLEIINPLVICNEEHRFIVAEQLRQITRLSHNIILEPVGRNTAPAIALAALQAVSSGDDPLMLVLAADHVIQDEAIFRDAVNQAIPYAEAGKLATSASFRRARKRAMGIFKKVPASTVPVSAAFRALSKSLILKRRSSIWPAATISGIAVCFCLSQPLPGRIRPFPPRYSGRVQAVACAFDPRYGLYPR